MKKKGKRYSDDNYNESYAIRNGEKNNKSDLDIDNYNASNDRAYDRAVKYNIDEFDSSPNSSGKTDKSLDDISRKEKFKKEKSKKREEALLKKNLKKRQKRAKRSKREVLSYEDMPLSEREENKKASRVALNKRRIIAVILIVVLLTGAVFFFANRDNINFNSIKNFVSYSILNKDKEESFPINIQGTSVSDGNFTRMGRNLCYSSSVSFNTVNDYGKIICSSQISYSNPVLVTDSNLCLIYNLGGKGFEINSLDKNVFTSTAENNILVADIVDNGTYALVTQCDGYLSKLYVYNNKNEQIFAYSFADYYITSVSLNSKGTFAVLCGVSAVEGGKISCVYALDFTQKDPIVFEEFKGNILYHIEYLNDAYACVIGNTASYGMKVKSGEFTECDYEGKTLTSYFVNQETDTYTISLSRSTDGRNCDMLTFTTNGKLSKTINTDLQISSLSTYKDKIAALSQGSIYLYDDDSRLLSTTDAGLDPHAIVLYSKNDAYVLGVSEILRVDL